MARNRCGHLGFPVDTVLAHFDPEIILLLQSNIRLKATEVLGRDVEKLFTRWQLCSILDFLLAHLANLCLLSALMLTIKF